jgi:hypothetical protein
MFNIKEPDNYVCDEASTVFRGDSSYISTVKWDSFINNMDKYIGKAYEIQDEIEDYDIYKEVE